MTNMSDKTKFDDTNEVIRSLKSRKKDIQYHTYIAKRVY